MRINQQQQGFTLIELITVIVILAILATTVTSFIGFGTSSYKETTEREQLIATARFAIERLNREVRQALPNSLRTAASGACLEFVPVDKALIYDDIAVAPEPGSNTVEVYMLDGTIASSVSKVSVYALNATDIYNETPGIIEEFDSINNSGDKQVASTITFASAVLFAAESPTKRLYLIDQPVSYCIVNQQLLRYQDYAGYLANGQPNNVGVLMAELLTNFSAVPNVIPFQTFPAILQRNGLAQVRLKFELNNEQIIFNTEIQVPNVP